MSKHFKQIVIAFFSGKQDGSSIVLAGLSLMVLLAMTGLVTDMGTVYVTKTKLQKAADAAALSGAQELTHSESAVKEVVHHVANDHRVLDNLVGTNVVMDSEVTVRLRRQVALSFSGLFGTGSAEVNVRATAAIVPMSSASGAAPLGIDDSVNLVFGREYKLKVDQTESDNGYFGILALGGPGARTYEDNLKYGYQNPIRVGDILDTQTGNIAGKTRVGVQERIDNCPYPPGEMYHRDCPRILLIPVYRPYEYESNQLKQVKVTGFAYFYISAPMDNHDKTIRGVFIKRTGTGMVDSEAADNGAYGIRLTE